MKTNLYVVFIFLWILPSKTFTQTICSNCGTYINTSTNEMFVLQLNELGYQVYYSDGKSELDHLAVLTTQLVQHGRLADPKITIVMPNSLREDVLEFNSNEWLGLYRYSAGQKQLFNYFGKELPPTGNSYQAVTQSFLGLFQDTETRDLWLFTRFNNELRWFNSKNRNELEAMQTLSYNEREHIFVLKKEKTPGEYIIKLNIENPQEAGHIKNIGVMNPNGKIQYFYFMYYKPEFTNIPTRNELIRNCQACLK